ncbi:MAG: efflux RND transporter periplasmic adaptor subunit [Desulfobacteraceae bacterium]|nr:efflux RND transporter periplasmic adaptor subunit [Desulfobacteraceae bacterium]
MKRSFRKIAFFLILLILIPSAVLLVRHKKAELNSIETVPTPALPVHVCEARQGKISVTEHYLAEIEPVITAELSAQITGSIESVNFDAGDRVEKNEIVAVIDDRKLQKELSSLQAELQGAKADLVQKKKFYDRRKKLFKKGHTGEEDLETAESAYISAQARVRSLEEQIASAKISLSYTKIHAPFDGVVTRRIKDAGNLVMPGQAICKMQDPSAGYKILAKIPQQTGKRIKPGDEVLLTTGKNRTSKNTVSRIYPAVGDNRLATAEIRSDKPPFGLPSGSFIGVDIVADQPEGIFLPARAVLEYENQAHVFIIGEDNRVKVAKVRILGRSPDLVTIAPGPVAAGDRLVSGGEAMLLGLGSGSRVQPIKNTADTEAR